MTSKTINNDKTVALNAEETILASRYRIVRQLGQGGMGSVWLAEDAQLDNKPFAIKMLPSILVANKRAYRQLKDEALVAMRLVHPNIVQIRAFEENDGNPFLVMDYVDGQTLDDYLAEHVHPLGEAASRRFTGTTGLPEADVLRILRPIAAALDYAHAKGVVHRDVKPGNVMIAKDGTPYILDFGIAREIQETMTRVTGKLSSGTLLYMSPEQLHGASPKPAQDIYSFAAMVYECLKGEPPFVRGAIEDQIMNKQPEPLDLPTDGAPVRGSGTLAASVMAGLAKAPEDRPVSCMAVLKGSSVSREPSDGDSSPERLDNRVRSSSFMWKCQLAMVALAVAFAGGWWVTSSRNPRTVGTTQDARTVKTMRDTHVVDAIKAATSEVSRVTTAPVATNAAKEGECLAVGREKEADKGNTGILEIGTAAAIGRDEPVTPVHAPEERPEIVNKQIVPTECVEECAKLEKELANLQSGLGSIGTVAWIDEKEVSVWEKLHGQMAELKKQAWKASARAVALAESIKPVVRIGKGDKTVAALDARMERLSADLSTVAKQVAERLAIIKGKIPLTKFANACKALSHGMTEIPVAYDKKKARMAEIRDIESRVRSSRTRNYSDLEELARKTAAIRSRSLAERVEEITLGQQVGKMIGERENFMSSKALRRLQMQVPGEAAHAQIKAELAAFKHAINVSLDSDLPGRFANIESKAFQLADLSEEDALLQRLEEILRTVQRLAARGR